MSMLNVFFSVILFCNLILKKDRLFSGGNYCHCYTKYTLFKRKDLRLRVIFVNLQALLNPATLQKLHSYVVVFVKSFYDSYSSEHI